MHTVLHALMTCVAKLQALWHYKAWLTDAQVEEGKAAAARLRQVWEMLRWKPTVWVHWAAAHSGFYMERYRSIYLFSNISTEVRNSGFKVELRNCFKGWSVRRPLLNRRGLKHVVNMHALASVWQSSMPNRVESSQRPKERACDTVAMVGRKCCTSFAKYAGRLNGTGNPPGSQTSKWVSDLKVPP